MCCRTRESRCRAGRFIAAAVVFGGITVVGGTRALPIAVGAAILCLFPWILLLPILIPMFLLALITSPFFALHAMIARGRRLRELDALDEAEAEPEAIREAFEKFARHVTPCRTKKLDQSIVDRALDADRPSRTHFIGLLNANHRTILLGMARDATDPVAPFAWHQMLLVADRSIRTDQAREELIDAWAKAMSASNAGHDEAAFLAVPDAFRKPAVG